MHEYVSRTHAHVLSCVCQVDLSCFCVYTHLMHLEQLELVVSFVLGNQVTSQENGSGLSDGLLGCLLQWPNCSYWSVPLAHGSMGMSWNRCRD